MAWVAPQRLSGSGNLAMERIAGGDFAKMDNFSVLPNRQGHIRRRIWAVASMCSLESVFFDVIAAFLTKHP
jgi:hypothetical protein